MKIIGCNNQNIKFIGELILIAQKLEIVASTRIDFEEYKQLWKVKPNIIENSIFTFEGL